MENVIENMAHTVAKWSVGEEDEEQVEIVTYGITLFIESIYKMIILMIIAILTHKVYETVVVIGSFCGLRLLAGGIHCKTSIGCTSTMILIWLSGIMSVYVNIPILLMSAMLCVSLIVVAAYAPAATKNNPITDTKIIRRKKIGATAIVCIQIIVCATAVNTKNMALANMVSVPVFIEAVSILMLKLEQAREKENLF
ncbi:MAG: accessory gene regulator B family protein [Clostridium sp.]|nr:accessory gene regulator B family protein [Clostridium sp.]MCM1399571.1 accessory gene regulator B family protein [Clostridium sp.]MCM1460125.1 accessory gene regulator B family protein [Bacteroides sp.]